MRESPHVGEVGRCIDVACRGDMSGATAPYLLVQKPSGNIANWTAEMLQDEAGFILRYTTKLGDLNEAGQYKIHPYVTTGSWTGPAGNLLLLRVKALFS